MAAVADWVVWAGAEMVVVAAVAMVEVVKGEQAAVVVPATDSVAMAEPMVGQMEVPAEAALAVTRTV